MIKSLFGLLAFTMFFPFLQAQDTLSDTAGIAGAYFAGNLYRKEMKQVSGLYTGSEYYDYSKTFTEGSPYYLSDSFSIGSVDYNGDRYDNVPLLYDIINDVLITKSWNAYMKVQLISERVKSFSMGSHHFIHLFPDTATRAPSSGFYEVLYDGGMRLLKKPVKSMQQTTSNNDLLNVALSKNYYYLLQEGRYYEVKNKSSIYTRFGKYKNEVQHYFRSLHLSFRKNREKALTEMVRYYDQLKK